MLLRPFLNDTSSCASYLFGCGTHQRLAVVDPHGDLVDEYLATAASLRAPIVAVFETHVQADHVSGLPALAERTGATAYLPADAGVEFEHVALSDSDVVELGNTLVTAIATPGHAPAHHAYAVADRRRAEPALVNARPCEPPRKQRDSTRKLLDERDVPCSCLTNQSRTSTNRCSFRPWTSGARRRNCAGSTSSSLPGCGPSRRR